MPSSKEEESTVVALRSLHYEHLASHHQKRHSASGQDGGSNTLSEPTIQVRRKSSPSLNPNASEDTASSPTSKKTNRRRKKSNEDPNETLLTVNKMELFSRRRLSSPPSLLQDQQFQLLEGMMGNSGQKHGAESNSSSRGSSGHGSLQQLAISGLNLSSTDMRNNTIRSGHQDIGTLFAANNITYQDPISINLVNAPDNSTTQCDCGHINCPMCNLMMNLELTDPDLLK
ncbi:unnamed protein product [Lepeophtheirus salmonis]|uniref:(salmon louse) hypothetical protein n=1 Tax=Lepeophtheirus salmonis TaxID=72036 RepID=A0A7R8H712_LEPSM|nr:unnamed protein product [Lepeophtheirus salmonis]CAF2911436.1 unnamed protein product [Lepeophtheirus salmonis]